MGKQQDWFLATCVYLFLSLVSQIHSASQTHFLNRVYELKQGIGSSGDSSHFNGNKGLFRPLSGVNQVNIKKKDLIKKLPGQPSVSFKQYGGYVDVDESIGRYLYYYFVEAVNANASTPLVLWFNGGPGCSSLHGAFLEHGPFRVHSDGKTLYRNPYSWNNEANVLYLESPAIVGFSYTKAPSTEYRPKLVKDGDRLTAEDNYAFLVKWLERFPEYKGREFYITGQSYAGHYGPQLAQKIIQGNNKTFINLRGILIGNPGLDKVEEKKGEREFKIDHAMIREDTYDRIAQICSNPVVNNETRQECATAALQFLDIVDDYNIYAPMCLNSTLTSEPKKHTTILHYDPCSEDYLTAYLNRANVQGAMHANTTKLPYAWKSCADVLYEWNDNDMNASILPILHEVLGVGVRVFLYSGDIDAVIPFTSTKYVLKKFNQTIEKMWRPWYSEGEVGGYVEEYKNNFTYATVRGAGHSVPSDQPIRALTLFTSFIRNTILPKSTKVYKFPDF